MTSGIQGSKKLQQGLDENGVVPAGGAEKDDFAFEQEMCEEGKNGGGRKCVREECEGEEEEVVGVVVAVARKFPEARPGKPVDNFYLPVPAAVVREVVEHKRQKEFWPILC